MSDLTNRLENLKGCPYCGNRPEYWWDEPRKYYNAMHAKATIYMRFKLQCSQCKSSPFNCQGDVIVEPQRDGELKIIADHRPTAEETWNRRLL